MNEKEAIRKIKISLTRSVYTEFLALNLLSLVIRMSSFLLVQGRWFHRGVYALFSGRRVGRVRKGGQNELLLFLKIFLRYLMCQGAIF